MRQRRGDAFDVGWEPPRRIAQEKRSWVTLNDGALAAG